MVLGHLNGLKKSLGKVTRQVRSHSVSKQSIGGERGGFSVLTSHILVTTVYRFHSTSHTNDKINKLTEHVTVSTQVVKVHNANMYSRQTCTVHSFIHIYLSIKCNTKFTKTE